MRTNYRRRLSFTDIMSDAFGHGRRVAPQDPDEDVEDEDEDGANERVVREPDEG
jgi:hypothetical protein